MTQAVSKGSNETALLCIIARALLLPFIMYKSTVNFGNFRKDFIFAKLRRVNTVDSYNIFLYIFEEDFPSLNDNPKLFCHRLN